MAKQALKITLSPSRDFPLDRLTLSQSNVRRIQCGVSIGELADDIARRTLLQSLNVRPLLDGEGQETGQYEIPAGGRHFRALELLVKQKRLSKDAPIPCIVRAAGGDILAEDDSLAENVRREALHPLDQFRAMQAMTLKGQDVEGIAAHFFVTPAVVRQRLKLASVFREAKRAAANAIKFTAHYVVLKFASDLSAHLCRLRGTIARSIGPSSRFFPEKRAVPGRRVRQISVRRGKPTACLTTQLTVGPAFHMPDRWRGREAGGRDR